MNDLLVRLYFSAVLFCGASQLGSGWDKPPAAPTPLWAKMQACVGRSHLSKELQEVRNELGRKFEAFYYFAGVGNDIETGFWHSWYEQGLALRFDDQGNLEYFILWITPAEGYQGYKQNLPFGLRSDDSPADVRRKLGEPAVSHDPEGASSSGNAHWQYPGKGLSVHFTTNSSRDSKAKLLRLGVDSTKGPR